MRHGRVYTIPLEAGSERQALADLALFDRDPEGFANRSVATAQAEAERVHLDEESAVRFLSHLKAEGRTEKYRRNVRTYLAAWAKSLAGRDLRRVTLQD